MVAILHEHLDLAVEHHEELIAALERYRGFLLERLDRYRREGRDPVTFERNVTMRLQRLDRLIELLDGQAADLLRWVVDGVGTLESVDEGRWI